MRRGKWIIFGMLVALLAGCSGKKTAETSADAKNAESTDEKNTLDFVDAHGEHYTVEINEAVAKNPYDKALFVILWSAKKYSIIEKRTYVLLKMLGGAANAGADTQLCSN